MVETLEWIHKFKNHEVFKRILSNVSRKIDKSISRNILASRHGNVFLWDETSLSLLSFQLKNFLAEPHKDFCQELIWMNPPRFDVDHLLLASPSSNTLALYGRGGVQVLSLPSTMVQVTRGNAKPLSCLCTTIDEHFFVTSGHNLIHLSFHPGFSEPDVLFILTSDNFIRIYSTEQPHEPLALINLQPLSATPLSSKSLLGESFVSFAFSEMLEFKTKPFSQSSTTPSSKITYPSANSGHQTTHTPTPHHTSHSSTTLNSQHPHASSLSTPQSTSVPAWNVYLLLSSGQVFYLTIVFDGVNTFRHHLHGSMRMYPAADDNYGLDACSLLHLPTTPPLLVVATTDGHLHHSLILNPETANHYDAEGGGGASYMAGRYGDKCDEVASGRSLRGGDRGDGSSMQSDEEEEEDRSFFKSIRNLSTSFVSGRDFIMDARSIYSDPDNKKALYVYQTVELEVQISSATRNNVAENVADKSVADVGGCNGGFYPLLLHKDVCNKYRYHCSQPNGVYSILPLWLNKIEHFFTNKEEQWSHDDQTIVEHLMSTSPLNNTASAMVIGVVQITDPFLGSHIITLTDQYTIAVIPCLQSHKLETHPLNVESLPGHAHSRPPDDFVAKVTSMLVKDANVPLISGSSDATLNAEECFGFLCRTTQVFRTQYIAKYDLVRVEIDKNISRLEKVKARQKAEQERLQGEVTECRGAQDALRKKLKEVVQKQSSLCCRLSTLTYNAEKGITVLSDAEKSALGKLREIKKTVDKHSESLSLLKKKYAYYDEVISTTPQNTPSIELSQKKSDSIKKLLKNEGEEIANLIKDLKKAQIIFGV